MWRTSIAKNSPKIAQALADPEEYENLFDGLKDGYRTEEYFSPKRQVLLPASSFVDTVPNQERNAVAEMQAAAKDGLFVSTLPTDEEEEEEQEEEVEEEDEEVEEIEIEIEDGDEDGDSPLDEEELELDLEGVDLEDEDLLEDSS